MDCLIYLIQVCGAVITKTLTVEFVRLPMQYKFVRKEWSILAAILRQKAWIVSNLLLFVESLWIIRTQNGVPMNEFVAIKIIDVGVETFSLILK